MSVTLDKIFPIADESSAQLMAVKAQCLFAAGVITDTQKQAIEDRAAEKLRSTGQVEPRAAARFQPAG